MKEFAVFWGCTIQTRFPFIEKSTRMVLDDFKLPYRDIDGFTCCPEKSLVNNVDHAAFVVTAARNVALVDEKNYDLVSPCTGCVSNLATVKSKLKYNPGEKAGVNALLKEVGREFKGTARLFHLVPFFHDAVGVHAIRQRMKRDFTGMRVAVHYGCHMIRPSHALRNDDPLEPKKFDSLMRALGAESLEFETKMMCCGQGLDRVDQHENALHMARIKLRELKAIGADALVLCCPSCFLQFDNNQFLMEKEGEKFGIPVIYYTELLGLALGHTPEALGMTLHRVDVGPFIRKWEVLSAMPKRDESIEAGLNAGGELG
ncbi:MAG: CoB--CoM heterodisulfide reductase iron-sulfur subunit B family protein [Deltaproteobacteria bacterium]|nr:CoB--CoM heterodisulfide reductase iron-sulfur subunit B family protein [Deltaproteobacteria bacterium]MBI5810790.1 CoB--CoM heterodisulfide reductase iron-sulfur subunit B family protein [Deltaproteobacteria bacterium]